MNLYENISSNKRKSIFLIIIFFIIIGFLGYSFGLYIGDAFIGLGFAIIFSTIMALISFYSGDRMILGMSSAMPADRKKYPYLVNTVEGLAIAAGIPTPKIYVIDDSAINAFATGRDPKHASVTVTTGAIKRLKRDELEGVISHELSHVRNYDIRMMMFVVVLVGLIALLSDFFLRTMIYGKGRKDMKGGGIIGVVIILLGLVLAILAPLIAQLIKLAVSRKREFLADADGALLSRNPDGLANALKKIKDDKEPLVEAANKATAHLFIENPLRTFRGSVNSLFSTHPDINERIKRLEAF
ncbi:M48 family metallopeptidase [Candidatus Woesearchaeota archaeon]|nr:M48 family metallopeptidase [Candidatus Woesearchaeota archaeon]